MASQTPKAPAARPAGEAPKRGIKNPLVYAGTIVVFIIVVVAFVFVPAFGGGYQSGTISFGSYAGKPITYVPGNFLAQQVQSINDSLRQQGLSEQNFQFYAYQVWRGAFERTVLREAVLDAVRASGGAVSQKTLDARMAAHEAFQVDGKFSARAFRETPLAQKTSIRQGLEDEALSQYYYSDVYALAPSSREVEFVTSMAKETRTVEYAAFPLSAYPDFEVSAWAAANPGRLRRLTLSRITVADGEDAAKKLRERVASDAISFAEAAKAESRDSWADKGGLVGQRFLFELESDLASAEDAAKVAALGKGGLSPVLKTSTGSFAFFRADEAAADADLADPAVLAAARSYMERFEKGRIEDWSIARAKDFAAAAASGFARAAKAAGVDSSLAGPFPLNYGDLAVSLYGQNLPLFAPVSDGSVPALAGASRSEAFLSAAFSLAPGAVSEPIVLGENVVVLQVKEAGSALDEDLQSIGQYFPYFFQMKTDAELRDVFLESEKLKDGFMDAYFKYFAPKQS